MQSSARVDYRHASSELPFEPSQNSRHERVLALAAVLETAVTCLASERPHDALLAASEACHAAPTLAEAHYVYGQAWSALGDERQAERAFAAALQVRPDWAEGWLNYGMARYRNGSTEDAKIAMRQALAVEPGHEAAAANLGAFLRLDGEGEAAERLLRDIVAHQPDAVGARLNLAAELIQAERADEALELLETMTTPNEAAQRQWRLQQALALLELGRAAEAREALDAFEALGPVPAALKPLWHWRLVLLALAEADPARARREADLMERALGGMGSEAVPEHAIMARYDLAKFWSGEGEHSRAFALWAAAHVLLKPSQPFSRDEHQAFIDANIATFTAARFADGARATNRDERPVFIVGMPRSGTTLCHQIISAHADVHGAGERNSISQAFSVLGGGETSGAVRRLSELRSDTLDAVAANYLAGLEAIAPGKARVIDKMPANYLYLGLAGLILPGARIIHCVRDPRDIGLSIFTYRFHGRHGYAHDLADLGWTIRQQDRLMAHWKAALPNPILTVALADWVEDFDGTLARVLAHLELPHDETCVRFQETERRVRTVSRAQVRQPIDARGLGRWRTYETELAPLIAALDDTTA